MTQILPLSTQSPDAIEHLLDAAFGTDRHGRTAYAIRLGMSWLPELSYAALADDGALVGTLQSWPVALDKSPLIMVGPVAVMPALQNGGHGRALMDTVVGTARLAAREPLMMIGDPEYYGRFWGFSADGTTGWRAPGPFEPRRLLALDVGGGAIPYGGMLGPRMPVGALRPA